LTGFFPIVDIVFRCRYVRSKFKDGPKKIGFAPPARGTSDQIFKIAVIYEYVSKFG